MANKISSFLNEVSLRLHTHAVVCELNSRPFAAACWGILADAVDAITDLFK